MQTHWTSATPADFNVLPPGGALPAGIAQGTGAASWLRDVSAQLDRIAALPAGWDSNDAPQIEPQRVAAARALATSLAAAGVSARPHVNPTPAGGVQLEWEFASRYVEVEVVGPARAVFYYRDLASGTVREGEINEGGSLAELVEIVGLVGRER